MIFNSARSKVIGLWSDWKSSCVYKLYIGTEFETTKSILQEVLSSAENLVFFRCEQY